MTLNIPVALFVYNRPDFSLRVFERIRAAKPTTFVLVSDGPKNEADNAAVDECRTIIDRIDWPCDVIKIFSDVNMGCKRRFFTALDELFIENERMIILEDDCLPNSAFFSFCAWALDEFENNPRVSIVSGSNLGRPRDARNGFSRYMNCWGWATWRSRWREVNPHLGGADLRVMRDAMRTAGFMKWERAYWTEVMKHSILSTSIWDFYVQEAMFRLNRYSVYPGQNLIENIGFDSRSTHTGGGVPDFVMRSRPTAELVVNAAADMSMMPSWGRDRDLAKEIWSCSWSTALRLKITNMLRYAII